MGYENKYVEIIEAEVDNTLFNNHPCRTVEIDGQVWWFAKDVCELLEIKNSRQAVAGLEDEMKQDVQIVDVLGNKIKNPYRNIINFSGVLRLLNTSKTKKGKEFQRMDILITTNEIRELDLNLTKVQDIGRSVL